MQTDARAEVLTPPMGMWTGGMNAIKRAAARLLPAAGATARLAARLRRSTAGGVAMMFGLAMPVISLTALAGVDIYRASSVRMNLQDALDAAALAAARSPYIEDQGITRVGLAALRANMQAYPNTRLLEDQVSFHLNEDGVVVASARAEVETLVADMFLGDNITIGADAEVMRSNYRIELALVIDNTGSMAGTKLRNTQQAATDLIDRLAAAASRSVEDDAVRIALVPFSMTVRVSEGFPSTQNVSRAAATGWLSNASNHTGATGNQGLFSEGVGRFTLLDRMRIGWAGCVESRPYPYDVQDTPPAAGNQATQFVPYFAPDEPDAGRDGDYSRNQDRTWYDYAVDNNYLDDRTNEKNWWTRLRNVDKYRNSGLSLSGGRGPNRGCSLEPMTRLTDDFQGLKDSIDDMVATGNTNVPFGLMWGWHALSPNAPFRDGRPYGEDRLRKIVVLMTDGENVNSTYGNPNNSTYAGVGYIWQQRLGNNINASSSASARRSAMDGRLAELCRNMKTQDIVIYTVAVQVDRDTQAMLETCATSADHYFNVTSASGIAEAFDRIAGSIENLRISR